MFEISWSELLILAVVALIFIGPKDLPAFFNTLGKYAGALRRQANEFKSHFEDAMREAEMENLRKELDSVREEVTRSVRDAERAADESLKSAETEVKSSTAAIEMKPDAAATPALPVPEAPPAKTGA